MSRVRLMLLSILVVFAVGAVASASASAAGQWWVSGAKFSGTEEVTARLKSGTKAVLKSKLPGGEEVELLSPKISLRRADIFANSKGLAEEITFLETTVAKPVGCEMLSDIIVKPVLTELVVEGTPSKVFDLFTPQLGTKFATVELSNCAGEGLYQVTGQVRCEVQAPEFESLDKLCLFSAATVGGVGLKFGTEPATLVAEPEFLLYIKHFWSAKGS
jgi:hypothetical protein